MHHTYHVSTSTARRTARSNSGPTTSHATPNRPSVLMLVGGRPSCLRLIIPASYIGCGRGASLLCRCSSIQWLVGEENNTRGAWRADRELRSPAVRHHTNARELHTSDFTTQLAVSGYHTVGVGACTGRTRSFRPATCCPSSLSTAGAPPDIPDGSYRPVFPHPLNIG